LNDWDPATEAEAAMRDALLASDQEQYFRILARMDLLLPVSLDALAGRAPIGWGTWTTGNRTHVLAFTSPAALQLCLNEPAGSYRTVPFYLLAGDWPNYEWWLAINPGLPIEAYLPSWFIVQLTRGDVHLPGRTMGGARARMAQSDLAAALSGRVRASSPAPTVPPPPPVTPYRDVPPLYEPRQPFPREPLPREPLPREPLPREPLQRDPLPREFAPAPGLAAQQSFAGEQSFAAPPSFAGAPEVPPPAAPTIAEGARPADFAHVGPPIAPAIADTFNGRGGSGETVEAEIIDYPPPAGAASTTATVAGRPQDLAATRTAGPTVTAAAAFSAGRTAAAAGAPPTTAAAADRAGAPVEARPKPGKIVRETHDAEIVPPSEAWSAAFQPANETEANLLVAAEESNTDAFLSTLLLARIILPVPPGTAPGARPRDPGFPWQYDEVDGQRYVSVYTSPERLAEHTRSRRPADAPTVSLRFVQLIRAWPDESVSFAINPGSPVGATLPGSQIVALASWATDVGLRDDTSADVVVAAKKHESTPVLGVAGAPTAGADRAIAMQRTVPHAQVPFYLERGYDRVAGFVNRASEVAHLTSPRLLYRALGLTFTGSPFAEDDAEVHVVRWVAHRADLYRLPYGGQHEAGMRAMQGWVIERPPFRGNGFAPGDTDVITEFKVDSVRLPHGAQMWRLAKDGTETLVATFDADAVRWVASGYGGTVDA
jgi:hypothetical protein